MPWDFRPAVISVAVLALALFAWSPSNRADEPGWTDKERLENREVVCLGTVLSAEKVGTIDEHADVYLATVEISGMKKGKKTAVGSKLNVYYEATGAVRSKRCPAYAKLAKGDKGTFYLRNMNQAIQASLKLKTVKEPALFLEMGSDFQKTAEILNVQASAANTVRISVGKEDGAGVGDVFSVSRDKSPIGRLTITEVNQNQSTATIVLLQGVAKLAPGDVVVSDGALQHLTRMKPDSPSEAPRMDGRGFAVADIARDRPRILHYGKPWSQGKPFIDDATGYAVVVTDGCIVGKDFTEFVDEYNLTMREHFQKTR